MPKYISLERLEQAKRGLEGFPPAVIAFLAMKKAGVNHDALVEYGSAQEEAFLNDYFLQQGAPPRKMFYIPFGKGDWRDKGYSGKTLQRARTSQNAAGHVFANGLEHPDKKTFRFRPDVLDELKGGFPKDETGNRRRINVFDLLAWMRRGSALPDNTTPESLVDAFKKELHLSNDEYAALFEGTAADEHNLLADTPIIADEMIRQLEGVVRSVVVGDDDQESKLITEIEERLRDDAEMDLPDGFVRRFYDAVKAQGFVVLVGKPGTGKTRFITAFVNAFKTHAQSDAVREVFEAVSPEHESSDVVGYENLAGEHVATRFVSEFIDSPAAREKRGVFFYVLDEFNLAHPDRYLSQLLPALESDKTVRLPGRGNEHLLSDTYILATANSYLDEETRLPLSGPVLRRAHIIAMPNALDGVFAAENAEVRFGEVLARLARQSIARLIDRQPERGESFLDGRRIAGLEAFLEDPDGTVPPDQRSRLFAVCRVLSEDSTASVTFGVLQDVLDLLAMGERAASTLDRAIVQKVLPQLRGGVAVVESLVDLLRGGDPTLLESLRYAERLVEQADPVTGRIQPLV